MSLPTPGAPTAAIIGKGTTVSYAPAGSTPTWVPVAELLDIKMPTHEGTVVEVQRYDSPTLYPELIPSWLKAGSVDLKLVYNAAQGDALFSLLNVACQFKITKPDTKGWIYQGMITKFGDEVLLKDKMMNLVTFSISGAPVRDTGSA